MVIKFCVRSRCIQEHCPVLPKDAPREPHTGPRKRSQLRTHKVALGTPPVRDLQTVLHDLAPMSGHSSKVSGIFLAPVSEPGLCSLREGGAVGAWPGEKRKEGERRGECQLPPCPPRNTGPRQACPLSSGPGGWAPALMLCREISKIRSGRIF